MNLKYFIVFVAGMAALAGCQEASEYIPSIYIDGMYSEAS